MNTEQQARVGELGDAPPVKLQAVVATISAPVLHEPPPATEDPSAREPVMVLSIDVPWAAIPVPPLRRSDLELALGVAVTAWLPTTDIRFGVVCGLLVCAAAMLVRIDRRIPFSFGQGFLGYRSDLGWPQGVQEDDDFHWNWKARAVARTEEGLSGR